MGIAIFIGVLGMAMVSQRRHRRRGRLRAHPDRHGHQAVHLASFPPCWPAWSWRVSWPAPCPPATASCWPPPPVSENILKGVFGLKNQRQDRHALRPAHPAGDLRHRRHSGPGPQPRCSRSSPCLGLASRQQAACLFYAGQLPGCPGLYGGRRRHGVHLEVPASGGAWDIYELLPAFLVSLILIVVVSLLTPCSLQGDHRRVRPGQIDSGLIETLNAQPACSSAAGPGFVLEIHSMPESARQGRAAPPERASWAGCPAQMVPGPVHHQGGAGGEGTDSRASAAGFSSSSRR